MVELEQVVADDDVAELLELIELHEEHTQSTVARYVLENWETVVKQFVKVMPTDYKRVLEARKGFDSEVSDNVADEHVTR